MNISLFNRMTAILNALPQYFFFVNFSLATQTPEMVRLKPQQKIIVRQANYATLSYLLAKDGLADDSHSHVCARSLEALL